MTLDQLKEKLKDRNIAEVARRCELPYRTVSTLAKGTNKNPSYVSVFKLVNYLNGGEK